MSTRSLHGTVLTALLVIGMPWPAPLAAGPQAPPAADPPNTTRWYVYKDAGAPENHGHWTNLMPKEVDNLLKDWSLADRTDPHEGESCVRINVQFNAPYWCGIAVASKPDYWGETDSPEAFDLRNASSLVFWAKGSKGGERFQVKCAIAGDKPFGDSTAVPIASPWISLTDRWQRYVVSIPRGRANLSRVITPFCFTTARDQNFMSDITFYIDEVYFTISR
jgi:hypothetical protein